MQRLTIPKRVQLPFGYVVTIKQVTDSEMEESPCRSVDVATSSPTNSVMPGTTGSTTRWIMGLPLAINSPA